MRIADAIDNLQVADRGKMSLLNMGDHSSSEPSKSEATRASIATAEATARYLTISERRYRRLFEAARDGILILDTEHGKITDANPFMSELLGYTHDELLGKELWEIGLIQDKEASQEAFRRLMIDKYIRYENLPLWNRNGEHRQVEFVSNLYLENGHTVIQCNIRDITARKNLEEVRAVSSAKNLRIAETLQRSMLQAPPVDRFRNLEIVTHYEAAWHEAAVGGDFFDTFALSDGHVALVVGDVSGKGLVAAERTAEVKYALRAFMHGFPTPEIALSQLNDFICDTHRCDENPGETFIVLALALIDSASGDLTYSGAGSEPALILRSNGVTEFVETPGWPLGTQKDALYSVVKVHLAAGDTILMATDGITEARSGNAFLGLDGFASLAEKVGPIASLSELADAISTGARDFADGVQKDDVCMLLARRR